MTTKRLGILLLAAAIYFPVEFLIWLGLGLDELIYPEYRKVSLPKPVFIIGNPRSGTTFLQRLLAKDSDNFHCMRTWEIFTAPSVFMRKLVHFVDGIGRVVGVPISKRVRKIEELWKDTDDVHRLKLRSPEEDERHYYFHGDRKKYYLSKNPNFSPAVQTLLGRFPDAKFIYLIRNPLEAVPSHISLKDREWRILGSPLEKYSCRDFIIKSSHHWYEYPLGVLESLPENQAVIVKFDDLVSDAEAAVQKIYYQLGISLSENFRKVLAVETVHARNHKSDHHYSLEEMGIKPQQMVAEFADVIHEFNFEGLEQ
ncbi:MAG: sulfotransferase [Anaerolineales bacterium]